MNRRRRRCADAELRGRRQAQAELQLAADHRDFWLCVTLFVVLGFALLLGFLSLSSAERWDAVKGVCAVALLAPLGFALTCAVLYLLTRAASWVYDHAYPVTEEELDLP